MPDFHLCSFLIFFSYSLLVLKAVSYSTGWLQAACVAEAGSDLCSPSVLVRASAAVKRHHDPLKTLIKESLSLGLAYSSEVQSIIIMGEAWWQAGLVVVEKELRVLSLHQQATGSSLSHWAWFERLRDLVAHLHSDTLLPTRPRCFL